MKIDIDIQKINEFCNYANLTPLERSDFNFKPDDTWDKELYRLEHEHARQRLEVYILKGYKLCLTDRGRGPHDFSAFQIPEYVQYKNGHNMTKLTSFSKDSIQEQAEEFAAKGLGYKSIRDYSEKLRDQDRRDLESAQRAWTAYIRSVYEDVMVLLDLIENADQRKTTKKLKRELSDAKIKLECWGSNQYGHNWCSPLEHLNEKGQRHFKIRSLYDQKMNELTAIRESEYTRIDNRIVVLNSMPSYETLKQQLLVQREDDRIAEEKKQAEELAKKREEEKKKYEALMKKLNKAGLGLGETDSNGKEKRSYASEEEAKRMIINIVKTEDKLLECYPKEFSIQDGTGRTKYITYWFLTSKGAVAAA